MATLNAERVTSRRTPVFKLILFVLVNTSIFVILLFGTAGTIHWWRAWVFTSIVFVAVSAIAWTILRQQEHLLDERLKLPLQEGQPLPDRILLILCLASWGGVIAFIPLDVFRLHLMRPPGFAISLLGLALAVIGYAVIYGSFRQNSFAATVVRLQEEQVVVTGGVYRVVRHPLYAGGSLLWTGMSLWLESYAAALLTYVAVLVIAMRIVIEERFLQRRLSGYAAYVEKVRYRLIPFIW